MSEPVFPYPMPDPVTEDADGNIVPVRNIIPVRRRTPDEIRKRLLDGPLPADLAQALADEIAPSPYRSEVYAHEPTRCFFT